MPPRYHHDRGVEDKVDLALAELRAIRRGLAAFRRELKEMIMTVKDDLASGFKRIDDATNAIAEKLRTLSDQIAAGGLTAEDETAAVATLNDAATKLEAIGKDPANPVPGATQVSPPATRSTG